MTGATYDEIGQGYAKFRRPDPRIADSISRALGSAMRVVNVGAGTGSYEPLGRRVVGVEPSLVMIHQRANPAAPAVRATAEALPFPPDAFDAALAVLTIHHWPEWRAGLREMSRVARRIVILTFDIAVFRTFWLVRDYIPAVVAFDAARTPSIDDIANEIGATRIDVVAVPPDCADGFCCAHWRRPEAYLDPEVRACISGLAQLAPADVLPGIARLRADLDSGRWHERQRELLAYNEFDGGYRLIVRE
jgi:SAM-dependent methyltransferase